MCFLSESAAPASSSDVSPFSCSATRNAFISASLHSPSMMVSITSVISDWDREVPSFIVFVDSRIKSGSVFKNRLVRKEALSVPF